MFPSPSIYWYLLLVRAAAVCCGAHDTTDPGALLSVRDCTSTYVGRTIIIWHGTSRDCIGYGMVKESNWVIRENTGTV
jgi:hypothetical protein